MYKLKVRKNSKCSCGSEEKLYSPKGYSSCNCFFCLNCWIDTDDKCNGCEGNVADWLNKIMKIDDCTICLLKKKLVKSPCKHYICSDCWIETGKRKAECPFCRRNLTTWMLNLGIEIGSEKMYDEDPSLVVEPSSILQRVGEMRRQQGITLSSLTEIFNHIPPYRSTLSLIRRYQEENNSSSSSEGEQGSPSSSEGEDDRDDDREYEEYHIGHANNPYYWGKVRDNEFHCGCGTTIPINLAPSHCRDESHIKWRDNL